VTCPHDCYIVIHAEGSDIPHEVDGKPCPCLPRVECPDCKKVLAKLGELRALPKTPRPPVHVYPCWQG
jgi:hypothetical protein